MGMRNLRIAAVTIDSEGGVNRHPIAPPDVTGIFVERFRRRAGELRYRHQHPIRGAEPEVRPVERFQPTLEMDTSYGGSDIVAPITANSFATSDSVPFAAVAKNRIFAIAQLSLLNHSLHGSCFLYTYVNPQTRRGENIKPQRGDMFIAAKSPRAQAPAGRHVYHASVASSASKTYFGLYGTLKRSRNARYSSLNV